MNSYHEAILRKLAKKPARISDLFSQTEGERVFGVQHYYERLRYAMDTLHEVGLVQPSTAGKRNRVWSLSSQGHYLVVVKQSLSTNHAETENFLRLP